MNNKAEGALCALSAFFGSASGRIMVLKVDKSLIFLTSDRSLDLEGNHFIT
jgi:hypothetical protein